LLTLLTGAVKKEDKLFFVASNPFDPEFILLDISIDCYNDFNYYNNQVNKMTK
jgi:hypothetical protein